jgi:hypothetical protein
MMNEANAASCRVGEGLAHSPIALKILCAKARGGSIPPSAPCFTDPSAFKRTSAMRQVWWPERLSPQERDCSGPSETPDRRRNPFLTTGTFASV